MRSRPFPHPETHLGATLVPGPKGSAHLVCDGCGQPFPAWRHVEGHWESTEYDEHARLMRKKARRRSRRGRWVQFIFGGRR